MPLSAISLERLAEVLPELSRRIQQIDAMAPELGLQVTQGLRTWSQQDALFNQVPPVTKAPGGYSWHNFGLAADVVPEDIAPGQPDWNTNHPVWKRLISIGESLGLTAGAGWRTFPDWPHFQLTGRFPVTPNDEVRAIYLKRGQIQDVWDAAFAVPMHPDLSSET